VAGRVIRPAGTELTELCDRVVVLRRGTVAGELGADVLTEQRLSTAINAGLGD
jgi:ABC-type sugar transport system ATPase subunit